MVHAARMLSRVRNHFQGAKFARMSSGTYCIIRDLGLVKGGKGMRHHEVLVTFSVKAAWRWLGHVRRDVVRTKKSSVWLNRSGMYVGECFGAVAASSPLRRLPRQ